MSVPSAASMLTIQRAYVAFYGRPADYAGQVYWASVLDQEGGSLSSIIQSFGNSEESNSLYGGTSSLEHIDKIYQQLFNRDADAAGRAWWAEQLDDPTSGHTLASAALAILGGAQGEDLALINRKVLAAERFTEELRTHNMSHAYGPSDIAPARTFLSTVTAGMSEAGLAAQLESIMEEIQNATWLGLNVASNSGLNALGWASGFAVYDGGLIFGDTGRVNSSALNDVYLATLNDSLQPGMAARIGHTGFAETLQGLTTYGDDGFLLWGDLDNSSSSRNTLEGKQRFLWKLDSELRPLAEARIGTADGNEPNISKVLALANGKILVVGEQNNYGDSRDAFAIVFNADLTVHAQRHFDSPARLGSNENFFNAIELNDGSMVLVGAGGELFRVDGSLNQLGAPRDFDAVRIFHLENDFLLVSTFSRHYVVDYNFNLIDSFDSSGWISNMVEKAPGEFLVYDSPGRFYNLTIEISTNSEVTVTADDYKILASRSGSGVFIDRFAVAGDIVSAVDDNNLFVFNMDIPESPNQAADYRVHDLSLAFSIRDINYNQVIRPDWVAGDMQIVTVGTLPTFTAEQDLFRIDDNALTLI